MFKKGDPKPANSGRRKGSKNAMKSLRKSLGDKGFDLGDELVKLLKNSEQEATKLNILKLIAQFTQTQPKTEHVDEIDEKQSATDNDLGDPDDPEQLAKLIRIVKETD